MLAARLFASTPPATPHPRRSEVEAFWNSFSRGLTTAGFSQFQLSFFRRRAGPRHSGEVRSDPQATSCEDANPVIAGGTD
jgi:hypothetical protein